MKYAYRKISVIADTEKRSPRNPITQINHYSHFEICTHTHI